MNASFRSFMGGLVDYAGLFPPAALDMGAAVAGYARHRAEPEAWMLGRFICPAGRLGELTAALGPDFAAAGPWELSVLVGSGASAEAALGAVADQGRAVASCEAHGNGQLRVAALESPLPAPAVSGAGDFLAEYARALLDAGLGGRELYLEVPAGGDEAADAVWLEAVSGLRRSGLYAPGQVAAKFRCGGVTPEAFPAVERLAGVIDKCRRLELPLKCTAGLHHPVRHRAGAPDVMMHGFVNVFGAGLLAHALGSGREELAACLAETDPHAFAFTPEGFAWRDRMVPAARITELRRRLLHGFGSCSFDEPRADLQELGLLP